MRRAKAPGNDKVQRITQNYFISMEIDPYELSGAWDYKVACGVFENLWIPALTCQRVQIMQFLITQPWIQDCCTITI